MSTEIRRLGRDDAASYRALRMRALWEFPEAFTSSYEEHESQPVEASEFRLEGEHSLFWGAFVGGQLCGMVGLERETRLKNRHKGTIVGMYVSQEHSGVGVGHAMIDALVQEAKRLGLELLVLTVTDGNAVATSFYEAAGFRSFGIEPRAIKVDGRAYGKNHMYLHLIETP